MKSYNINFTDEEILRIYSSLCADQILPNDDVTKNLIEKLMSALLDQNM